MIEILTLKLIIDLLDHLKVYFIEMTSIELGFYNKTTNQYQYYTFTSYDDLYNFYYERYYPFNVCLVFGDIWFINQLDVKSGMDSSYTASYKVYDVSGEYWIKDCTQFDTTRNRVWSVSKERQYGFLDKTISEYNVYYGELYDIYLKGVYSVCYAEPGWTEHTTILQSYRDLLFPVQEQESRFNDIIID